MASQNLKVVELPNVLRNEQYISKLDKALWRLIFLLDDVDLTSIEPLKKQERISTRIELTPDGMKHLSLFMENQSLSIVDAITFALNEIHNNKQMYFIGEAA